LQTSIISDVFINSKQLEWLLHSSPNIYFYNMYSFHIIYIANVVSDLGSQDFYLGLFLVTPNIIINCTDILLFFGRMLEFYMM